MNRSSKILIVALLAFAWAIFPYPPAKAADGDAAGSFTEKSAITKHSSRTITATTTADTKTIAPLTKKIDLYNSGSSGTWYANFNGVDATANGSHSIPIAPGQSYEWNGWTSKASYVSDAGAGSLVVVYSH